MAAKILELLGRPDLRQAMGGRGRKFFEDHLSLGKMIAETQKVYEDLLKK
jgi:glycosyltransferase involved in cell wall biosynthesis